MSRHISQRRQAFILLVLAFPVVGEAQTAADAATMAGVVGLPYRHSKAAAVSAPVTSGFPNTNRVAVDNPPAAGPIGAESSPAITGVTSPPPDCIVALSPTAGPTGSSTANYNSALFVGGNSLIDAGCGVQVNSTTPGSLWIYLGSILTPYLEDAAPTYWCGIGEGVPVGSGDPGCFDPLYPIVTMYPKPYPPISDPLNYLNPPASTTCDSGNLYVITGGANGGTATYNVTPGSGTVPSCPDVVITQSTGFANVTFHPGTYHSITMGYLTTDGSPGCEADPVCVFIPNDPKVTFASGVYNIMGSVPLTNSDGAIGYCDPYWLYYYYGYYTYGPANCGLSIIGSGATIQGRHVMFYLGPNAGGVAMDGYFCSGCTSNLINLAAPTAGNYAVILLYQDRSNANPACIGGCYSFPTEQPSSFLISGAMYFPNAGLYYTGCCEGTNVANTYQIAVANTLYFEFDNVYSDYSSLPSGSPVGRSTQ